MAFVQRVALGLVAAAAMTGCALAAGGPPAFASLPDWSGVWSQPSGYIFDPGTAEPKNGNAGAPGVTVTQDSRAIGKTSASGKYLVPNLRDWDVNNIGIDPTGLPLTFDSANTNEVVAPRGKSGVYIDFGGRSNVSALTTAVISLICATSSFAAIRGETFLPAAVAGARMCE